MKLDDLITTGAVWLPKIEQAYAWLVENGPVVAEPELPKWVLHELVAGGRILRLRRGVYLVPDTDGKIALPALAVGGLVEPLSYVSFYAALAHWGLTDQTPRRIGVVSKHRHRPIPFGSQQIEFLAAEVRLPKSGLREERQTGYRIRVAAPAHALLDSLAHPRLSAAPAEMLRVLEHGLLGGAFSKEELVELTLSRRGVAVPRRLGLLLEALTGVAEPKLQSRAQNSNTYLDFSGPESTVFFKRVPGWRLTAPADAAGLRAAAGVGDLA